MPKSMTGFGRGFKENEERSIDLEFKSVNSRYLDINIRMPKSLIVLEDRMRKKFQEKISRGKLDVFVIYKNKVKSDVTPTVNKSLALKYAEALKGTAKDLNLIDDLSISFIAGLDDVIELDEIRDDPESVWLLMSEVMDDAMAMHDDMRVKEGEALKTDIILKAENISEDLKVIESIVPVLVPKYREKLNERLNELNSTLATDDKIAMEVALFADRSAIDEEITRLHSHLEQLYTILEANEPIGRKLDFLLQEINREANTMSSKSVDMEITNRVLNIKNDMEKIREQVQNLE
ncbi:MAG: YicC/YloC family endoribonuclease [Clostridiaceae bacterium]